MPRNTHRPANGPVVKTLTIGRRGERAWETNGIRLCSHFSLLNPVTSKHHPTPLSGGDRKALEKQRVRSLARSVILSLMAATQALALNPSRRRNSVGRPAVMETVRGGATRVIGATLAMSSAVGTAIFCPLPWMRYTTASGRRPVVGHNEAIESLANFR